MKVNKLLLILFILIFCNYQACEECELNLLNIINYQLRDSLLEPFIKDEVEHSLDTETLIFILRIEDYKNKKELRIGALDEDELGFYLNDKKDKPIGYIKYKNHRIIVFGKNDTTLFELNNTKNIFPFLKKKKIKQKLIKGIPPPPIIYEPVVWVYIYERGNLFFHDSGRFFLLL